MGHAEVLDAGIAALVYRVLEADRDTVDLDRDTVRDEVIMLVMVQFFIELQRLGERSPHDSARGMVLLYADEKVDVAPRPHLRLGIERSQSGTLHEHRLDARLREGSPCLREDMLQLHLLLHILQTNHLHLRRHRQGGEDQRSRPLAHMHEHLLLADRGRLNGFAPQRGTKGL